MTEPITYENLTDREKRLILTAIMSVKALLDIIPEDRVSKIIKCDPDKFCMYILINLVGNIKNSTTKLNKLEEAKFCYEVFEEAKKQFNEHSTKG